MLIRKIPSLFKGKLQSQLSQLCLNLKSQH